MSQSLNLCSSEPEPEWPDDVEKNGELFYVEQSEEASWPRRDVWKASKIPKSQLVDPSPSRRAKISAPVAPLVGLLGEDDVAPPLRSVHHVPHGLMYLSLKMDATAPKEEVHLEEEILYLYPASEASARLKGARGIFLTLCDMLENVTGGHVVSSTLLLDKHLVHVGYWKEGDALLVVGLPAESVPLLCLQSLIGEAVQTLRVMFGSLRKAFCKAEHKPQLDQFFCLFFQRVIQPAIQRENAHLEPPCDVFGNVFLDGLPAVRWLTLPTEVKTELDSVLTDFEASDFGETSEYFFGLRRFYAILGSCLFYKSYLIANHLPKDDMLDVCLYMRNYCLLPAESQQRVGHLVIWRELFPLRPTPGRHFLLIVGLRFWVQCVLLEAGSYASSCSASPGPDCVYVDQVKATLQRLETLKEAVEEHLSTRVSPRLSCADWFLQDGPALGGSLFGDKARDYGSDAHGDITPGSPTRILGGHQDSPDASVGIFKVPWRKHSNPFHLGTLMKSLSRKDLGDNSTSTITSSGAGNTLFHYILMETAQGIFIAPSRTEEAQLGGTVHPSLIRNFYHCCLSIRAAFKDNMQSGGKEGQDPPRPQGLGTVKEHGVLFHYRPENLADQKKPAPTLTYWVVGRLLLEPVPQEFYVCFHESVPEVPVEMAFRLSFGLAV
nr:protein inturned-like [Nerophis lumbriciformis]